MYSTIQKVIKEYVLQYYAKYEHPVKLLHMDEIPYLSSGSYYPLFTLETSLDIFQKYSTSKSLVVIQNIFELWGLNNEIVNDESYKAQYTIKTQNDESYKAQYTIKTQNDEKIVLSLIYCEKECRCYISINDFSLYDDTQDKYIRFQLLMLLIDPLLFFEMVNHKDISPSVRQFFSNYKWCILRTVYNHTCKYLAIQQLVVNKGVIVNDMFVIVMNMYINIVEREMLNEVLSLL